MTTFQSDLPAVFGALSDATRLAVVEQLVNGPASVSELSRPFEMAGPTFLKHLKVLEQAGVVTSEKKGRTRTVRLAPETLDWIEAWTHRHRRKWENRLDRLGSFLEEDKESDYD